MIFVHVETSNFDMHWTTALFKMTLTLTVNETAQATKKETKNYPNSRSIKTRLMLFKVVLEKKKKKKKTCEKFLSTKMRICLFHRNQSNQFSGILKLHLLAISYG